MPGLPTGKMVLSTCTTPLWKEMESISTQNSDKSPQNAAFVLDFKQMFVTIV
jgi:hypothetical protein